MKTTWRKLISEEMREQEEDWDDVVSSAFDGDPDDTFDAGYGGHEGCAFTLWTSTRVYFPVVYDGAEWVASVPRNPCGETCKHVGGE